VTREGQERRGRGRDRYNRDRRERSTRDASAAEAIDGPETGQTTKARDENDAQVQPTARQALQSEPEVSPSETAATPFIAVQAPVASDSGTSAPKVAMASPVFGSRGLPKVHPFELPLADLAQIAEGSGLQWINSDATRVAQVRAAIEAEPKPVHAPRERIPMVMSDDGPLILVETRRDLAGFRLPFEKAASADARTP